MSYFVLRVVLLPAPVSYDSLVYSQQLSEQHLLDRMQASGHNYSNNCLLKGDPVVVRKILPDHVSVTALHHNRTGKCSALSLH